MKKNVAASAVTKAAKAIIDDRLDKLGRAVGLEAFSRLQQKTPVDTGHARRNWNAAINDGDTSTADHKTDAMVRARPKIDGFKLSNESLWLTNAVPYIERLENGWSRQAPQGMARITLDELKPLAERIAGRMGSVDV